MKKGFTLVEMISVIILLAAISMIAVPAISISINKSKQKSYETQVEIIISAAKKWAIYNNNLLPTDDSIYKLPLSTLISEYYINNVQDGKLKNPKDTANPMNGCVYISYSETYNQNIYEYKDEC